MFKKTILLKTTTRTKKIFLKMILWVHPKNGGKPFFCSQHSHCFTFFERVRSFEHRKAQNQKIHLHKICHQDLSKNIPDLKTPHISTPRVVNYDRKMFIRLANGREVKYLEGVGRWEHLTCRLMGYLRSFRGPYRVTPTKSV